MQRVAHFMTVSGDEGGFLLLALPRNIQRIDDIFLLCFFFGKIANNQRDARTLLWGDWLKGDFCWKGFARFALQPRFDPLGMLWGCDSA